MDDIARKLTKKKPVLVHQAYGKLFSLMLEKKKNGIKFTRMSEEIVLLKNQCVSSTLAVSQGACNILLACVQHDLLATPDVLTVLTSLTAQNKNLSQILRTIVELHNKPGSPVESSGDRPVDAISSHTLVYVLKQCGEAWRPILDIVAVASSSHSWRLNSINYFLPVFSYLLCTRNAHLTHAAKQSAWQLLSRLTIGSPRVGILMDHFVWFQSSSPDDLTEEISFLSHIYKDIIVRYPSYTGLFLLYFVNLLLTGLETNVNTALLWQHIEYLTTKVLAYRLDIEAHGSRSPHRHMVTVTMREIVPVTLLLLVQCIPHCDEVNLKQLLSISQTLIRYFSIQPSLYCSFLAPLLPWLSALSNRHSAGNRDLGLTTGITDPKSNPGVGTFSDQLTRDVDVFVQTIVTSLKPLPVHVPSSKKVEDSFFGEEDEDRDEDYSEEYSDLILYYSDGDFETEEDDEKEEEERSTEDVEMLDTKQDVEMVLESDQDVEMGDCVKWKVNSVYSHPVGSASSSDRKKYPTSAISPAQTNPDAGQTATVSTARNKTTSLSKSRETRSSSASTRVTKNRPQKGTCEGQSPPKKGKSTSKNSSQNSSKIVDRSNTSSQNVDSLDKSSKERDSPDGSSQTGNPLNKVEHSGSLLKKLDDSGSLSKKIDLDRPTQNIDPLFSPSKTKEWSRPGSHIVEHRRIRQDETRSYLDSLEPEWKRRFETSGLNDPEQDRISESFRENDPELNGRFETMAENENVVNVDEQCWNEFVEKDNDEEIEMWEVEWKRMFAGSERVVAAQCLIRKLNQSPVDCWDTEFDNSPGCSALVSGFLAAFYIHPHDGKVFELQSKDNHSKLWDFIIAQDPGNSLYLLLYLLARERSPSAIQHWFERIVSAAHDNDNIPTVLATLESLKRTRDPILTSLLIPLYASLYVLVPRGTFAFLFPLLTENVSRMAPWQYDVLRAHATRHILQNARPEIHGKELVPLLSNILSTYSDPQSSTAPVTLSLDAIRELCLAGVVDFPSVWASLGVLRHDTRPRVLLSLISLMECAIPNSNESVDTDSPVCSDLSYEISAVLWCYVAENISGEVTAAAFRALSRYNFTADYPLKYLHPSFRANIKIPKSLLGKLRQNSTTPEEHVMFIPGECFLNLLDRVNYTSVTYQPFDRCIFRYNQQGTPIFKTASCDEESLHDQDRGSLGNAGPRLHRFQCPRHSQSQVMAKTAAGKELTRADIAQLDELKAETSKCGACKWASAPPPCKSYDSFLLLMTSCIEQELKTYREIIYNSPYQDQAHSKEPPDYSYLPYKSLLRAMVKFIQAKLEADPCQLYHPHTLLVLDLLSSSYSKPLPPLNWSFLLNAYLKSSSSPSQSKSAHARPESTSCKTNSAPPFKTKHTSQPTTFESETNQAHSTSNYSSTDLGSSSSDHAHLCRIKVLQISASYFGSSKETGRSLSSYLSSNKLEISQAAALTSDLPILCEHLDSSVFQQVFDTYLKPEYEYYVERARHSDLNRGSGSGGAKEKKESNSKAALKLEDHCSRPDCSNPCAIRMMFQGIKDCFEKLGPKLTGIHLPPSTNLESNMLYLCTYVKQLFVDSHMLYINNYELFSQVISCMMGMPPLYHSHLFSPEEQDNHKDIQDLLNLHLVKEKRLALRMSYFDESRSSFSSYSNVFLIPAILEAYSQQEVLNFILQEIFPSILEKQKKGDNIDYPQHLLLLAVFCVCPLSHLLPKSLVHMTSLLYKHQDSLDFDWKEQIYGPMENLFPVALVSLMSPEQCDQVVIYLTNILQNHASDNHDNEDDSASLFHRTMLALKSHMSSESARLNALSICVSTK